MKQDETKKDRMNYPWYVGGCHVLIQAKNKKEAETKARHYLDSMDMMKEELTVEELNGEEIKIYKHKGSGHYIGSCVIVAATTREQAEKLIRTYLDSTGLSNERLKIEEFEIESGKIYHSVDGDY